MSQPLSRPYWRLLAAGSAARVPLHPAASRCIPAEPGGGSAGSARAGLGSARRGRAVIHRLKNALRLATYDTGEARGKRGSASGERQSVSCELLCLRAKSLPEPAQRARHRQLRAGQDFAPGASSVARSPSTPEYSDAHLAIRFVLSPGLLCTPHPQ